ncbi:putative Zinc protease [uncultured delta proteobacterium]|uniref:Putative Zinc protease n=1 Tax=uncultured delta proteobacterium TaxID=34034 RepID=A0A212JX51_9DELT|nr:putative Zinc protease [uncultured delta proteobacterium]
MDTQPTAPAWPPAFSVRISPRAKYPRLRVLPGKGLEVVLPRTMRPETAPAIVERHKEWVCKTLDKVCGAPPPEPETAVPSFVFLRGGVEQRAVVCHGENPPDPDPGADAIRLRAPRSNPAAALRELQDWVRRHAAAVLGGEAQALALRHALPYATVRFRRQRSRWGSCTTRGALSLNTCLIFLPAELARHVILHELVHTRHMDHGQGFWKTLFAMEPNALKLDKRLRTAWRFVPAWLWT